MFRRFFLFLKSRVNFILSFFSSFIRKRKMFLNPEAFFWIFSICIMFFCFARLFFLKVDQDFLISDFLIMQRKISDKPSIKYQRISSKEGIFSVLNAKKISLLQKEKELFDNMSSESHYEWFSPLKERKEFLFHGKNVLQWIRKEEKKLPQSLHVYWKLKNPVEIDWEDLERVVSLFEVPLIIRDNELKLPYEISYLSSFHISFKYEGKDSPILVDYEEKQNPSLVLDMMILQKIPFI